MELPPVAGLARRLAYGELVRYRRNNLYNRNRISFNDIYGFNYEELSRLQNVQTSLSIDDLLNYTILKICNENQLCVICQDMIYKDVDIIRILNCKHFFHSNCIDKWFCSKKKCPLCNKFVNQVI